jgi:hypothetical protein
VNIEIDLEAITIDLNTLSENRVFEATLNQPTLKTNAKKKHTKQIDCSYVSERLEKYGFLTINLNSS